MWKAGNYLSWWTLAKLQAQPDDKGSDTPEWDSSVLTAWHAWAGPSQYRSEFLGQRVDVCIWTHVCSTKSHRSQLTNASGVFGKCFNEEMIWSHCILCTYVYVASFLERHSSPWTGQTFHTLQFTGRQPKLELCSRPAGGALPMVGGAIVLFASPCSHKHVFATIVNT